MFVAVADAIVARLQAEQVAGGTLEEVKLVRFGDLQPIPAKHQPAISVDWDGARDFHVNRQQVELRAVYQVYLYTSSMDGAEVAEREAGRLVWDDSSGSPRGLLPALCRCARTSIVVAGQPYLLAIGERVQGGILKEGAHSTSVAMVEIQATTIRNTPQ